MHTYGGNDLTDKNRRYYLRKQWGITPQTYEKMFELQDGKCAICQRRPKTKPLQIDHDHSCCKKRVVCGGTCIRGLLCVRCNHGLLGYAHDSPTMLRRALSYLENPPAKELFDGSGERDGAGTADNSTPGG